jgi:hypothetical protein
MITVIKEIAKIENDSVTIVADVIIVKIVKDVVNLR